MNKKIIIIAAAVLVAAVFAAGIYLFWSNWRKQAEIKVFEKAGEAAETITDSATKGVLPSININLLENKPEVNPADAANPIKNIKINPFE
ncbi:MAG: hypothetical protein CEN87_596 [Parcubacteria group bacterium Licking1014_1]|nr:MAG: hypothetical protein CEN87_596 [Parcubacteria group bacterium Licking1014_1]